MARQVEDRVTDELTGGVVGRLAATVDLDPAPFTQWITACGLDGYAFTSMARELGRELSVDDVRPAAAQAFADVFGVAFEDASALAA